MCSAGLPPLGKQPLWPRAVRVDSVPHVSPSHAHRVLLPWDQVSPAQDGDISKNMAILEKRFQFLQQQHADTLGKLHQEIEQLRRENRDLQYQIIMNEKLSEKGKSSAGSLRESKQRRSTAHSDISQPTTGPTRHTSTTGKKETETKDIAEEAQVPDSSAKVDLISWPTQPSFGDGSLEEQALSSTQTEPTRPRLSQVRIPIISLKPLLVNGATSQPPRAPTLPECESIIHQLWNINHTQAQELMNLKTFLKDVVYTNKWTPESYLVAKALLCHPARDKDVIQFPKVVTKGEPKKWVKEPVTFSDRVILPAMKQTLGNSLAERQKRSQAVQRSRLRRPVM